MRITPTGNIGINTTDPTEKLEVNGNIKADTGKFDELYLGTADIRDTVHINRANWLQFIRNEVTPSNITVEESDGTPSYSEIRKIQVSGGTITQPTDNTALITIDNGVTSVQAGNGMNFTTITGTGTVTMGTPSSITSSSTNNTTSTSHTHYLENGSVTSSKLNSNIISGQPAITSGILDTDELLLSDGGTLKRMDASVFKAYIGSGDSYGHWKLYSDDTYRSLILSGNIVNFKAGTNMTIGYSSTNNTLTFNATGGSGSVTSVGLSAPTGFSVSGTPVTTSGTLALSFASGYSLPTTASQSNWNTAYNDKINSLAVTGTTTKTITLTQQDGGTVTGTFTDLEDSKWATDTYGINYRDGNVGIGRLSSSIFSLDIKNNLRVTQNNNTVCIEAQSTSTTHAAIYGYNPNNNGIRGIATAGGYAGVSGDTSNGSSAIGVNGNSDLGYGVKGHSNTNYAGYFFGGLGVNSNDGFSVDETVVIDGNGVFIPAKKASAPSTPVAGMIYFNTTDSLFYGYNGTTWKQLDN